MRYVILGKTGLRVSALGFGCMRLPEKSGRVNRDLAIPLLRRAVELGVNLFDSAVGYVHGDSEAALGEAMQGMRDKVVLSTKNPHRGPASKWRAQLEESLRRLRTDHIDIYHHHGMNWGEYGRSFDPAKDGMTKLALKAKEEGLIRHIGFSFHDDPDGLKHLADTGYYENVIVQYNLLDQSNADAIAYAHEKGMGVVVMGPVGGGRLGIGSDRIQELTGARSTVEAALRFVWAHPGVNVALSGMENLQMLEENVALAASVQPFSSGEVKSLNELVRERKEKSGMYCSGCRYCVPVCNAAIPIPDILEMMNQEMVFGLPKGEQFRRLKNGSAECISCGRCVDACPQRIAIPDKLRQAAGMWDARFGTVITTPVLQELGADGSFALTLKANNFSPSPTPVEVQLDSADGVRLESTIITASLGAYERQSFTIKGKTNPTSDCLRITAKAIGHGKSVQQGSEFRYLIVAESALDDWSSGIWHTFAAKPSDFTDGGGSAEQHHARFRVGKDRNDLILHVEVADDFLYPTREDRDKGSYSVDCIELFLDGRVLARCGHSAYEKGVVQVFLYPGHPGGEHKAFYYCRQPINVQVQSFPMPAGQSGYRVVARIPFAEFCIEQKPQRIGFDLSIDTADNKGGRVGQYAFAGDGNNCQNASKFSRICLV